MNNNTETIEQAAQRLRCVIGSGVSNVSSFVEGAKYQKEKDEAKYKALLDSHNLDLKTIGNIKRNCEKINEHTWKMYKEQILLHIESIEVANKQS